MPGHGWVPGPSSLYRDTAPFPQDKSSQRLRESLRDRRPREPFEREKGRRRDPVKGFQPVSSSACPACRVFDGGSSIFLTLSLTKTAKFWIHSGFFFFSSIEMELWFYARRCRLYLTGVGLRQIPKSTLYLWRKNPLTFGLARSWSAKLKVWIAKFYLKSDFIEWGGCRAYINV